MCELMSVQNSALGNDGDCSGYRMQMNFLQSLGDRSCPNSKLAHVVFGMTVDGAANTKGENHQPGIKSSVF